MSPSTPGNTGTGAGTYNGSSSNPANTGSSTYTGSTTSRNDTATGGEYGRDGHNFGWIGLLGLAGLIGLARRDRTGPVTNPGDVRTSPRL